MIIIPFSGIDPNRDISPVSHEEKSFDTLDPRGPVQAGWQRLFILIIRWSYLAVQLSYYLIPKDTDDKF